MNLSDIDVTSFPAPSKEALLDELFSVSVYKSLIAKRLAENNFNLPVETSTELLQIALALHIKKPAGTITTLKAEAEMLRAAGVSIFPEVSDLGDFSEAQYSPIKAEAIAVYEAHEKATKELLGV